MIRLFKLLRIGKILFTIFTMYVMRYFVITPILAHRNTVTLLEDSLFSLLVISVCFMVAASNVINDYFDSKADTLSGREVLVGKSISRRSAIWIHSFFNLVAVVIAFILGVKVGYWWFGLVAFGATILFWLFSSYFKKVRVLSNLFPALAMGCTVWCAGVVEFLLFLKNDSTIQELLEIPGSFAILATIAMLIYEINKDFYSMTGDRDSGNKTLPVCEGVGTSRRTIGYLTVLLMGLSIVFVLTIFPHSFNAMLYLFLAIVLPGIFYTFAIYKEGWRHLQLLTIQFILLAIVCFAFLFNNNYLN